VKPHRTNQNAPKRSIGKKISTAILIVVFTFLLVCAASVITTKFIYHKPAALFGYRIVKIVTDSMSPEIPAGSYILVKNIDGADVQEGDVVVHIPAYGAFAGMPMTHKCVKGPYYDVNYQQTCILTQGTKEGAPIDAPVPIANVQSVYLHTIAHAGSFFDFLTSRWGVITLVALPCLIVVVLQISRMIRAVVAKPDEDKVKEEAERIEKERAEAQKQAVLQSMIGQDSANGAAGGSGAVGDFGDVMAYIAREKAKSAEAKPDDGAPPKEDEMSSVLAFIAKQKALAEEQKQDSVIDDGGK